MTIASKLEVIDNSLASIKSAIIAKGQTPSGNITTYATAISSIPSGGGSSGTPYTTIVALENAIRGTSELASTEEAEACDDISLFLYGATNS